MTAKTTSIAAVRRTLSRGAAGQAMVEYAIISASMLGGLMVLDKFFLPMVIEAYQFYLDVFFFMLNLPVP